jgi:hypothetical protein
VKNLALLAGSSLYVKWQGESVCLIHQSASLIYPMNRRLSGRFGGERKLLPYLKSNEVSSIGWIFMKFDILSIFKKSVKKIQVSLKSVKDNEYFT